LLPPAATQNIKSMANPQLPMQMGSNLPGLDDREEDIQLATEQDAEMKAYAEALDLDTNEVEEEVIDSIVALLKKDGVNLTKKLSSKEYKVLPESEKDFNKYFVDMDSGKIINQKLFSIKIDLF
jgi:hypothetical protein